MIRYLPLLSFILLLLGCSVKKEHKYSTNGGFQKVPHFEQETAPGMLLFPRMENESDTLGAFYISKFPETNAQYVAYLNHLKTYQLDSLYIAALPDTNIWINTDLKPEEKENLHHNYLRGTDFKTYPVLGLSDEQIKAYAMWKTDRLNEYILWRDGYFSLENRVEDKSTGPFTTKEFMQSQYDHDVGQLMPDLDPAKGRKTKRRDLRSRGVKVIDGIIQPDFYFSKKEELENVIAFDQLNPEPKYHFKKCGKGKLKTVNSQPNADFLQDREGIKMNFEAHADLKEMGILPVRHYSKTELGFHIVDEVQIGNQKLNVLRLSMPRIGRVKMK